MLRRVLMPVILFLALGACSYPARLSKDYIYQYTLIVKEPIERYDSANIGNSRRQNIPAGDTILAESASLFTGIPAFSKVIYQRQDAWVFNALSKTTIVSKKKVLPSYRKAPAQMVIYGREKIK